MRRWVAVLIFILFLFTSSLPIGSEERVLNPSEIYDASMELYHKNQCEEALKGFSEIVQHSSTSKLVSYSQYMIGLCYLKMGRYEEAIEQLMVYLKNYPSGDRVKEAELGIQLSKEKLKEKEILSTPKSIPTQGKVKRRICAQISYLDSRNLLEVEKKMKTLKEAGVNTLILRVFQNKGDRIYRFVKSRVEEGVYFQTQYAPVVEDILGKLVEIAHRQGLDLFAWMTTRYADYGLSGHPEYRCKRYNFETQKMEIARGYNLFHPEVLERLEGLFRDLGRYPIDGILFQDDLILRHNEDFSAEANKAFQKEFGYLPHPERFYVDPYLSDSGRYYVKSYTDRFWTWANWKNRWLMKVAKRLMSAARESNPNLQFAINLYFETILNASNSVAWFSQTLSGALETHFDYYAIMAYHRQAMKSRNIEVGEAIHLMAEVARKAIESVGDPSKVLMKIWILNWKSNKAVSFELAPLREVDEILSRILDQGEVSLAFVPYLELFPIHQFKEKWRTSSP